MLGQAEQRRGTSMGYLPTAGGGWSRRRRLPPGRRGGPRHKPTINAMPLPLRQAASEWPSFRRMYATTPLRTSCSLRTALMYCVCHTSLPSYLHHPQQTQSIHLPPTTPLVPGPAHPRLAHIPPPLPGPRAHSSGGPPLRLPRAAPCAPPTASYLPMLPTPTLADARMPFLTSQQHTEHSDKPAWQC